jgi:hypothetical protein
MELSGTTGLGFEIPRAFEETQCNTGLEREGPTNMGFDPTRGTLAAIN